MLVVYPASSTFALALCCGFGGSSGDNNNNRGSDEVEVEVGRQILRPLDEDDGDDGDNKNRANNIGSMVIMIE